MRRVSARIIREAAEALCVKANTDLRPDIMAALKHALRVEKNKRAKNVLGAIIENAKIAGREKIAICQDTGMVFALVEIGRHVKITGGDLEGAVNGGVREAYRKGYFRKSVVKSPLSRINTGTNSPCVLYVKITRGSRVRITVSPVGFGSENKTRLKMFNPTATIEDIKRFIVETAKDAGPDACPPFIVGIGIGGTSDKAVFLAKEAVLRPLNRKNPDRQLERLERELLSGINKLGVGPMGLGGKTTALGVNVLDYPTHIAGMPVAVKIGCHATRSASKVI